MRHLKTTFSFVFILVVGLSAQPLTAQQSPTLQEAQALYQDEHWAEASQAFETITQREPENGRAWYWLGMSLHHMKEYGPAIKALQRVDEMGSAPPIVKYQIAKTYALSGDVDEALGWLGKATEAGFSNAQLLKTDEAMAGLRNAPRFAEYVALADKNASPCEHSPMHRQFDFWIGEWEVYSAQEQRLGTNTITKIEKGCILKEEWTSANGGTGMSVNYYDTEEQKWKQLWLDASGNRTAFTGSFEEGAMHFVGKQATISSTRSLVKMTFTPLDDGRVRQYIEQSTDDGKTWTPGFDGYYVRKAGSTVGSQ